MTEHPNVLRVQQALKDAGLEVSVRHLDSSTHTAQQAADVLGVTVSQIGKSVVFVTDSQAYVAVVPGDRQISIQKLSHVAGRTVRKAVADEVKEFTGFRIGGVSPVGHAQQTVVDTSMSDYETVWCAAGTPHAVFKVSPKELFSLRNVIVANIVEES